LGPERSEGNSEHGMTLNKSELWEIRYRGEGILSGNLGVLQQAHKERTRGRGKRRPDETGSSGKGSYEG